MLFCFSIFPPPGASGGASPAVTVLESWPEMVEVLSKPVSIAILLAGIFGLIVGWLVRGRGPVSEPLIRPVAGLEELRWRHEKLVLIERQQVEKQARLDEFAASPAGRVSPESMNAALWFFVLAERVREARQKTGADLSRMLAVRDRLGSINVEGGRESEAVKASVAMAELRHATLEKARDQLRAIGDRILHLEGEVAAGRLDPVKSGEGLRRDLREIKGEILSLPQGWATSGDETDRQIRELLTMIRTPEIEAVRDILLIDGAVTLSLSGAGVIDLAGAVSEVMAALEIPMAADPALSPADADEASATSAGSVKLENPTDQSEGFSAAVKELATPALTGISFSEPAEPAEPVESAEPAEPVRIPAPLPPDDDFRDPVDFAGTPFRSGKGFHDLTTVDSVSAPAASEGIEEEIPENDPDRNRSLILFCSNDAEMWGKEIYRGASRRARAIKDFPAWAQWISIRRLDTRERVFAPIKSAGLLSDQMSDPSGFNGTNELFYGARHLGIFSGSCPNDVETRFTYGGWGFGHRANGIAPESEQLQAAGWGGLEIPSDTVFEIVIHEELPVLGKLDHLLEEAGGDLKR